MIKVSERPLGDINQQFHMLKKKTLSDRQTVWVSVRTVMIPLAVLIFNLTFEIKINYIKVVIK